MADQKILSTPEEEAYKLQEFYFEVFGDRDWNEYKYKEHSFLKRNIGYAIFGEPDDIGNENIFDSESGYNKKQCNAINEIYDVILKNNFHETSIVHIRYILVCCISNNKKKTLITEPVFVIRKCRNRLDNSGKDNCKIYIDSHGRVYQSWSLYLENNKLPKCTMMYPKNGKYSGNINGDQVTVILEERQSPACCIGNIVLKRADKAGTVVSVATTATFVAAIIPGIVVAPAVLTGAALGGIGVGLYSVGRSISTLVDRAKHDQSIGLDNAESRWCWLNTTVGVLGAGTSAATGLLTRAASKGTEIGKAAKIAFNTLTTATLIGSGVNIVLSGYNIIDKIINEEKVTPLEVFQLASSMLFFHNSVTTFRTASTIISETQTATLHDYNESLRSNRHRKIFKKAQLEARRLRGETAGNAEIISGMQNINDPDNFFAGLARMNKEFNRNGARYTITGDGRVQINSNYIVDPMEFATVGKATRAGILKSLPPRQTTAPVPKVSESKFVTNQSIIKNISEELLKRIPNLNMMVVDVLRSQLDQDTIALLLEKYSQEIIQMFFRVLVNFLNEINDCLNDYKKLYPFVSIGVSGLQFIIAYIENGSAEAQMIVSTFLRENFNQNEINLDLIRDMADSFRVWLKNRIDRLTTRVIDPIPANLFKQKVLCKVCAGHHYALT